MGLYYDRQGQPMTLEEWAASFEQRESMKRVAETTLPNGRWVSTVWLGLNHSFGAGQPLIFETMVFPGPEDLHELDCDRYSTEADAVAGHARLCEKWAGEEPEADSGLEGLL